MTQKYDFWHPLRRHHLLKHGGHYLPIGKPNTEIAVQSLELFAVICVEHIHLDNIPAPSRLFSS